MTQFGVPVVMLAFNRPAPTRAVFDVVRQMQPTTLLVALDGPRPDRPDDLGKCAEVRHVFEAIDWPCRLLIDVAPVNMGARRRVASGLTWAFSQVEEAVILEDDCVPSVEFFQFCEQLLDRYRHDPRIMHIGGANLAPRSKRTDSSYLFSRYPLSTGWATWRRAWNLYDSELAEWPKVRMGGWLRDYLGDDDAGFDKWTHRLDAVARNEFDSWATIWTFSCWIQNALSVIPIENQIKNIGLGDPDATHTKGTRHLTLQNDIGPLPFPLQHPRYMIRDMDTDRHLAARPLLINDYSGWRGYLRRLKARRVRKHDNALWNAAQT